MKHFRSEKAFAKYRPEESLRKKISRIFKRKQKIISVSDLPSHYKSNPFKPKNQVRPSRAKLKLFILFIVVMAWLLCLAFTPYFKIKKILYFNLGSTPRNEVDSFIQNAYLKQKGWLPRDNYFFVDSAKLADNILDHFSLESVIVEKKFPSELHVEVREKTSAIIYDNAKKYYLLDKEGTIIKELADVEPNELKQIETSPISTPTTSSISDTVSTTVTTSSKPSYKHTPNNEKIKNFFSDYPIIYDKRNIEIQDRQQNILPTSVIDAAILWQKEFAQQGRLRPKFFTFENINSGVTITTGETWEILIQPTSDITAQITILKELLTTAKPKEYIDLRFGEKIYWK